MRIGAVLLLLVAIGCGGESEKTKLRDGVAGWLVSNGAAGMKKSGNTLTFRLYNGGRAVGDPWDFTVEVKRAGSIKHPQNGCDVSLAGTISIKKCGKAHTGGRSLGCDGPRDQNIECCYVEAIHACKKWVSTIPIWEAR